MGTEGIWKVWGVMLLLLFACQRANTYQKIFHLENHQWPEIAVIDFTFEIGNAAQAYDIFLLLKNTPSYPYQNLYITYSLKNDTERLLKEELINCPIFDAKTGNPLGQGLGSTKNLKFLIATHHYFSHEGMYSLKLRHSMRINKLPGLQAIGIKVRPSNPTDQ